MRHAFIPCVCMHEMDLCCATLELPFHITSHHMIPYQILWLIVISYHEIWGVTVDGDRARHHWSWHCIGFCNIRLRTHPLPSPPCAISYMQCDTTRAADVGLLNRRFYMPDRCYCNIECSQLLVSIPNSRKNGIEVQMPDNIDLR